MSIENVQRKFTRLIKGLGLKSYEERLKCLNLTTLLERRMRGDLIETFKIFRGLVNYGKNQFIFSRSGYNIIKSKLTSGVRNSSLPNRVANYWNKIPDHIKDSQTVCSFKGRLEKYKIANENSPSGNFFELSGEIFKRLDQDREAYTVFMLDHPDVAERRGITV